MDANRDIVFSDKLAAYRATGAERVRNELVEMQLDLVRATARSLARKLPGRFDPDDLLAAGAIGLMRALDSFDSSRNVAFRTFATHRIRGAMLDDLRAIDWVPRALREQQRRVNAAIATGDGQGPACADWLGTSRKVARVPTMVSFVTESHDRPSTEFPDPAEEAEVNDVCRTALGHMNAGERFVVRQYLFGHRTMKQIADRIGLSESRISQKLTTTCTRLRQLMSPGSRQQSVGFSADVSSRPDRERRPLCWTDADEQDWDNKSLVESVRRRSPNRRRRPSFALAAWANGRHAPALT